jgi:hypothetical protein
MVDPDDDPVTVGLDLLRADLVLLPGVEEAAHIALQALEPS